MADEMTVRLLSIIPMGAEENCQMILSPFFVLIEYSPSSTAESSP